MTQNDIAMFITAGSTDIVGSANISTKASSFDLLEKLARKYDLQKTR